MLRRHDQPLDPEALADLRVVGRGPVRLDERAHEGARLRDDREDDIRANADVTLEHIGDPRAVEPLTKHLSRERDERTYNDCCRALGRCGAKQDAARKTLLHELAIAKSPQTSAGPAIGLAYFEKDAEAARGLEKAAKKEGDHTRRAPILWALSEVGDPKSAEFVKRELLAGEKVAYVQMYLKAIIAKLDGSADDATEQTIGYAMGWSLRQAMVTNDAARRGRDQAEWKPKGEFSGGPGKGGFPGMPPGGGAPAMGG